MEKKRVVLFAVVGLLLLSGGSANAKWCGWHGPFKFEGTNKGLDPKVENQTIIARYGYEAEHSVEEIKDLLDPFLYAATKKPEIFGRIRINLTQTWDQDVPLVKKYFEATKEYKGTCKIGPKGELLNYKAGQPFPDPKTGIEVFWNFYKRFNADDRWPMETTMPCTYADSGQVRWICQTGTRLYFDGRLEKDPKPLYQPNPTGLDTVTGYSITWPRDLKGFSTVSKRYKDLGKDDEMWTYLPTMRRVRAMSTKQREDYWGGGALGTWDTWENFDGSPVRFDFKIVERKQMIVSHIPNYGKEGAEWEEGKLLGGLDQMYQKRNIIVLDIIPKDSNYHYSKWRSYIDVKTGTMYSSITYDRKGRPWIWIWYLYRRDGGGFGSPIMNYVDLQRNYSANYIIKKASYNIGITPDYFDVDNMKKYFPAR